MNETTKATGALVVMLSVVVALSSGAWLIATMPGQAGASMDVSSMQIDDSHVTVGDGETVREISVDADLTIEYEDFDGFEGGEIFVYVDGPDGDRQILVDPPAYFGPGDGSHADTNTPEQGIVETGVYADVILLSGWETDHFMPDEAGETETTDLTMHFVVLAHDESGQVVETEVSDTFTVEVTKEAEDEDDVYDPALMVYGEAETTVHVDDDDW